MGDKATDRRLRNGRLEEVTPKIAQILASGGSNPLPSKR
jgi:hypothetical protein